MESRYWFYSYTLSYTASDLEPLLAVPTLGGLKEIFQTPFPLTPPPHLKPGYRPYIWYANHILGPRMGADRLAGGLPRRSRIGMARLNHESPGLSSSRLNGVMVGIMGV